MLLKKIFKSPFTLSAYIPVYILRRLCGQDEKHIIGPVNNRKPSYVCMKAF